MVREGKKPKKLGNCYEEELALAYLILCELLSSIYGRDKTIWLPLPSEDQKERVL